jgi:3-hydroxybutyryl-CoA dehydrogenase
MKIFVLSGDPAFTELTADNNQVDWERVHSVEALREAKNAAALFNLQEDAAMETYGHLSCPIFINSVTCTLKEKGHHSPVIRINGWNGFLKREQWEVSGELNEVHMTVLDKLHKKYTVLPDEPGFIAPRIIAMIINEAFYAKGEKVSTEDEIDIAMKLGTNYPKGPFEWMREIGIKNIYSLLLTLSKTDNRYLPSPFLIREAEQS